MDKGIENMATEGSDGQECLNKFVVSLSWCWFFRLAVFCFFAGIFTIISPSYLGCLFRTPVGADAIMFWLQAVKKWKRYNAIQGGAVIYASKVRSNQ